MFRLFLIISVLSYQFKNWIIHNASWRTIPNSPLGFAACLSKNSKFLIRTADAVRHANIVQMVKSCYKIKIDFRDFASRFLCFLLHLWRPDLSIQPLLHSNSNAIRVKKRLYCMTTEAVLECKSGSIAAQWCLFGSAIHCTLLFLAA